MKIDRLLGITIYLLNHKKTSSAVLEKVFEVSKRTIIRDMDTLCLAGIPVISMEGVNGGYSIMDTFYLQKEISNQEDIPYIICALQALATAYDNQKMNETIKKMQTLQKNKESSKKEIVQVDFSVARENKSVNEKLFFIHQCIQKKQGLQFTYTNGKEEEKEIMVDPICTIYKWYAWYLIGYSFEYNDYRMYKLIRMEHEKTIVIPKKIEHDLNQIMQQIKESNKTQKEIKIELYCKKSIRIKCREYLKGTIQKEYENGDFIYSFTVPENETFWYGVLLSFASKAKVLRPQGVIERVKADCREILENYED